MAQAALKLEIDTDRLEKIARMAMFDVPYKQIGYAVGVDEDELAHIMQSVEYVDVLEQISAENFEKYNSLNDGWDVIEATAMKNVLDTLNWSKDGDYALKAATMANRATRRGNSNQSPIDGRKGARAVIHLSAQFVDKLQVNNHYANTAVATVGNSNGTGPRIALRNRNDRIDPKLKDSNSMSPEGVEKLFAVNGVTTEDEDGDDFLSFVPELTVDE